MSHDWKNKITEYIQGHKQKKHWNKVTAVLAVMALTATSCAMILPALTMENNPNMLQCDLDLHSHDDSCYDDEGNIICGYADFVVHTHDESCYDENGDLICPLEEIEEHEHTEDYYTEERVLICDIEETEDFEEYEPEYGEYVEEVQENTGHVHTEECYDIPDTSSPICGFEESEGHTHSDECYQTETVLVCELEENEEHTHSEECYEQQEVLICDLEESEGHTHTDECYPDPEPVLICGLEEGEIDEELIEVPEEPEEPEKQEERHAHDDSCYEIVYELTCDEPEIILHTHDDSCYDEDGNLQCGLLEVKEHIHTEACLPPENEAEDENKDEENIEDEYIEDEYIEDENTEEEYAGDFDDIDLQEGNYITDVSVSHGDGTEDLTEVTEGDSIFVRISFFLPAGKVVSSQQHLLYQLDGITISEEESGIVYHVNEEVGTYEISTDGLITIYLNDDYVSDGAPFSGTVLFSGIVSEIRGGEEGVIDFGSDNIIIVLPKVEETDIGITKHGEYSSDNEFGNVEYTVIISSEDGTDGDITFNDQITSGTAVYDETTMGTISVAKYKNNGFEGNIDVDFEFTNKSFSGILPELGDNERYEITYTAKPDFSRSEENGELYVENTAAASDGSNTVTANTNVRVSGVMITKVGSYNATNRTFTWRITINRDHRDIAGYTLYDTISYYIGGQEQMISDHDIVINQASNQGTADPNTGFKSLPYTFQPVEGSDSNNISYSITYSIELPEGVEPGALFSISNDAVLKKETVEFTFEYGASNTIQITTDSGTLPEKRLNGSVSDNGEMDWIVTINNPDGIGDEGFTYIDALLSARMSNDTKTIFSDSHYITKTELEKIEAVTDTGVTLDYGTDFEVYAVSTEDFENIYRDGQSQNSLLRAEFDELDELDWTPLDWFNDDDHISVFKIEFTGEDYGNYGKITLSYTSQADLDELPSGTTIDFYNSGRTRGNYTWAHGEYYRSEDLRKEVSSEDINIGSGADVSSYNGSNLSIDYDETGGVLHYRIMFKGNGKDSMTVYDLLPAGTSLVKNSVRLATHLQSNDGDKINISDSSMAAGSDGRGSYISYTTTENQDGTTLVEFELNYLDYLPSDLFGIYYDVDISRFIGGATSQTFEFTNKAFIDGIAQAEDSVTTSVAYNAPLISKDSMQIEDNDNYSDTIQYYIKVNVSGEDLAPEDGKIILEDHFYAGGADAWLMEGGGKVKVYYYSGSQTNGCGAEMDSSLWDYEYSVDEDTGEHTIRFILPDETACVIAYQYEVDRVGHPAAIDVLNTVTLQGQTITTAENEIKLEKVDSSAEVNRANLMLFKVDSLNKGKIIDAVFSLQRYSNENNGWINTTLTANDGTNFRTQNGTMTFDFLDELANGKCYNTLYKLTEVEAPDNYLLESTPHYFVWMSSDENIEDDLYEDMVKEGKIPSGVKQSDIEFIEYGSRYVLTVENEPTSLTVVKQWVASDDVTPISQDELEELGIDSIQVALYRWTESDGGETSVTKEIAGTAVLDKENDWTYTWTALPMADENGKTYRYSVEELDAPEGFKVSYSENNDEGIKLDGENISAEVTVTNTKNIGYVLPQTGGNGPSWAVTAGLLLIGVSCVAYIYLRRIRREGGHNR